MPKALRRFIKVLLGKRRRRRRADAASPTTTGMSHAPSTAQFASTGSEKASSSAFEGGHIRGGVETVGARFQLLLNCLAVAQGDGVSLSDARNNLRSGAYAGAFDYFIVAMQSPTQPMSDLHDDIVVLIQFWNALLADGKHLTRALFDEIEKMQKEDDDGGRHTVAVQRMSITRRTSLKRRRARSSSPASILRHPQVIKARITRSIAMSGKKSSCCCFAKRKVKELADVIPRLRQTRALPLRRSQSEQRLTNTPAKRSVEDECLARQLMRKRVLLLALIGNEIERLCTWYNPLGQPERSIAGEAEVRKWREDTYKNARTEMKLLREDTRYAWELSPALAVHMYARFGNNATCKKELQRLVMQEPRKVRNIPEALLLLVGQSNILESDAPELSHILRWAPCSPAMALAFFNPKQYPPHPTTAQYAVRVLKNCTLNTLLLYIPQMVQALRNDSLGFMTEFLVWAATRSQLFAHQLLWNMQANKYIDEEGKYLDEGLASIVTVLSDYIISSFPDAAAAFYKREFDFFEKIINVSAEIRPLSKGQRKNACLKALSRIDLVKGCYLPSNPEATILDIDRESGTPLQSAAKAPYLARFLVRRCGVRELERIGELSNGEIDAELQALEETQQRRSSEENENNVYWQAAIFKVGDDCRQDMLALQIMRLMNDIFKSINLDVYLYPYRVVATAPGCGVIECVPNAKSRDQLGRQTDTGLFEYFVNKYGNPTTEQFQRAKRNFIRSMAGYSVFSYLLQTKDRHNGNIMIDEQGHIIHIDFGFMFESSPGGNIGFEPDFKLSDEMLEVMGESTAEPSFLLFETLTVRAFLAVRPHCEKFVSLVSLMLDTGLPCFRGRTIPQLRQRFLPQASETEAAQHMRNVIRDCCVNYRSTLYDQVQYVQNEILYFTTY